jgi:hypothetical protein
MTNNAGSDLGYAIGSATRTLQVWGSAALGAKAGQNYYELTGDFQQAVVRGAHAGRRWSNWLLFFGFDMIAWFVTGFYWHRLSAINKFQGAEVYDWDRIHQAQHVQWVMIIMFVVLMVIRNRNVDYSLFRRGIMYKLFQPLAMLLDWCPTPILYFGFLGIPWAWSLFH